MASDVQRPSAGTKGSELAEAGESAPFHFAAVDHHSSPTAKIDSVLDRLGGPDESHAAAALAGRRVLEAMGDWESELSR